MSGILRLWIWVALAGIGLIAAGFVYDVMFAGLPFQDPTPEMQARWQANKDVASAIMTAGGAALLAGLALGLLRAILPRR